LPQRYHSAFDLDAESSNRATGGTFGYPSAVYKVRLSGSQLIVSCFPYCLFVYMMYMYIGRRSSGQPGVCFEKSRQREDQCLHHKECIGPLASDATSFHSISLLGIFVSYNLIALEV
jgi:hypothetical protein